MGGFFDALMLSQQSALDQAAAKAAIPPNDGASIPSAPAFQSAPTLHMQKFTAQGGSGGFSVDTAQVSNVASAMGGQDVSTLQAGQSAVDSAGPLGQISTGGFSAGDGLATNFGLAYEAVSAYIQQLQTVYHSTVAALHKTVANYTGAESDNTAAANNVNG